MATPAEMRDRYQRTAFRYRNMPGVHGLRPYTVAVVLKGYDGGELGQGARTDTTLPIVERGGIPPKCRNMTSEELALAGYDKATWEIGPITPECSAGGTPLATLLQPFIASNTEMHFVLAGPEAPDGANFRLVKVQTDKALHYTVQVQRVANSGT